MVVAQVDDGVVVVLLGPQPRCQLEVVTGVQRVETEAVLDNLGGDADGRPHLGQTVQDLYCTVLSCPVLYCAVYLYTISAVMFCSGTPGVTAITATVE